jgi:Flp pilus assembly protein TadD
LNKSNKAIAAYDKAIELNPQNSIVWSNKAVLLNKLGKHDEAAQHMTKQLKLAHRFKYLV